MPDHEPRPSTGHPQTDAVRDLLDAAPSAVVTVDRSGTIGYANPRAATTFGYDRDDLVGQAFDLLVPDPGLRERVTGSEVAGGAPTDQAPPTTVTGLRRDGAALALDVHLTPLDLGVGSSWLVVSMHDVTAREAADQRLAQVSQAYLTLAQVNQAIVRAPDAASLFADVCRVTVEYGGYLGVWIGQRRVDGPMVEVVASAGVLDAYVAQLRISLDPADPQGNGPTAIALRESRPYYSDTFLADVTTSPWHDLAEGYGVASSASMPLRLDGETVAVLNLYSARPGLFDEQARHLFERLADNIGYALRAFEAHDRLELARARLEQVAGQRTELLRRLVTAQETERARIAGDVHDDAIQAVAAAGLRLGLLQRKLAEQAPDLAPAAERIQESITAAGLGLRQLLLDLDAPAENATCADAVREAAAQVFENETTTWHLECDDTVHLPDVEQAQALRIVKEALINVRKHAHASHVDISVRRRADGVEVTVTDDGIGIGEDLDVPVPGHRGLATMRDRAAVAGGWVRVDPAPDRGTVVRLWIPRDPAFVG